MHTMVLFLFCFIGSFLSSYRKSFQSRSGSSENQNQSISPLLKVLGKSTQVAKVADKDRPKVRSLI